MASKALREAYEAVGDGLRSGRQWVPKRWAMGSEASGKAWEAMGDGFRSLRQGLGSDGRWVPTPSARLTNPWAMGSDPFGEAYEPMGDGFRTLRRGLRTHHPSLR